jgi:transposase-like protein
LTEAQRGAAVALFEQGRGYCATATYLGIGRWAVRDLHRRWVLHGRRALVAKPTKTSYSFEFKLGVVRKVVDEGATAEQVADEHGLSSDKLVQTWVRTYRRLGEDGLKPKPKGRQPKDGDAQPNELTDLQRLEQENLRLRAENAYLKKLRALMAHERR